jgi:hypothetical protein
MLFGTPDSKKIVRLRNILSDQKTFTFDDVLALQ